jgi:hypothetical protein
MNRTHTTLIAILLTLAALAGLFAALRTTHLGAAGRTKVSAAQIAQRSRRLDAIEKTLLTHASRTPAAGVSSTAPVVYVRPKPIVHVVHRGDGDREGQGTAEGRGETDD